MKDVGAQSACLITAPEIGLTRQTGASLLTDRRKLPHAGAYVSGADPVFSLKIFMAYFEPLLIRKERNFCKFLQICQNVTAMFSLVSDCSKLVTGYV